MASTALAGSPMWPMEIDRNTGDQRGRVNVLNILAVGLDHLEIILRKFYPILRTVLDGHQNQTVEP